MCQTKEVDVLDTRGHQVKVAVRFERKKTRLHNSILILSDNCKLFIELKLSFEAFGRIDLK